jgi:hypothetical protein
VLPAPGPATPRPGSRRPGRQGIPTAGGHLDDRPAAPARTRGIPHSNEKCPRSPWPGISPTYLGLRSRGEITEDPRRLLGPDRGGGTGAGKDFKLYPGGGREWGWDETGTRHSPGIQPADVEELLAHGAEVVVLSQRMYRRLQVDPRTLDFLTARSVAAQVAETREAVRIYNDLTDGAQVAGLFHSTC